MTLNVHVPLLCRPAAVRPPGEEEFDDAADDEIYHSVIHRSTSRTSAKVCEVK